jgi:hypothetical protein
MSCSFLAAWPQASTCGSARTAPVLTVGESPDFIEQGGIINFVRDAGMMRFEIDQEAPGVHD